MRCPKRDSDLSLSSGLITTQSCFSVLWAFWLGLVMASWMFWLGFVSLSATGLTCYRLLSRPSPDVFLADWRNCCESFVRGLDSDSTLTLTWSWNCSASDLSKTRLKWPVDSSLYSLLYLWFYFPTVLMCWHSSPVFNLETICLLSQIRHGLGDCFIRAFSRSCGCFDSDFSCSWPPLILTCYCGLDVSLTSIWTLNWNCFDLDLSQIWSHIQSQDVFFIISDLMFWLGPAADKNRQRVFVCIQLLSRLEIVT